ncbi:GDP-mannose 4,6-dehydratase [Patescibacteria group bacterium]|nr:GDP-mannose 4,6-dehydratase [Patescibacteria group bacterium]MCL5798040.1 GDP-mannose 4,6-dehydratase [Patescibacteria group bacterium]
MTNFNYKNILITGATGFVGSHLAEELAKTKADITVTTHHNIPTNSYFATQGLERKTKIIRIELSGYKAVEKMVFNVKPDCIFHLAAQPLVDIAYKNPKTTLYSNIVGTINLLEATRLFGKTHAIIVASSDKAYGKILNSQLKYSESDPLRGDHPYEVSKSSADLISYSYYKTYGLPTTITRFGNIYGEGDMHFSRIIPGIMEAIVKKQTFLIRSNGKYIRDYLYVKDVVRGYLLLAQNIAKTKGEAYNFGSDDSFSVLDLIGLLEKVLDMKIKYKIINTAKNEIPYQSLDWTKIRKTVGWKPEYTIKNTMKNIYNWYTNYYSK